MRQTQQLHAVDRGGSSAPAQLSVSGTQMWSEFFKSCQQFVQPMEHPLQITLSRDTCTDTNTALCAFCLALGVVDPSGSGAV